MGIHVSQGPGRRVTVGLNAQNGQTGLPCAFTEIVQSVGGGVSRGQQESSEGRAIGRCHGARHYNVVAIAGRHYQSARAQVIDHIRQCSGTQRDACDATLFNVAFTDDVGLESSCDIQRSGTQQVRLPWDNTEDRAVINGDLLTLFCTAASRRHFSGGFFRSGECAVNIRCSRFIDNAAHHAGFFAAKKTDLQFQIGADLAGAFSFSAGDE